jgi:hypothetical protein
VCRDVLERCLTVRRWRATGSDVEFKVRLRNEKKQESLEVRVGPVVGNRIERPSKRN